jgi:hypothetical protein
MEGERESGEREREGGESENEKTPLGTIMNPTVSSMAVHS